MSMRRIRQLLLAMLLGLLFAQSAAFTPPGQLCGKSFAKLVVVDDKGKDVSDVTVELVGELPKADYEKFKREKGYVEYGAFNFRLSASEAEEMLKHTVPLGRGTDFCGNPLKQQKNVTVVRDVDARRQASADNFGFCTVEGYFGTNLLKISAPGYVTDYYLGSYLRGCWYGYSFVLTADREKGEPPTKHSHANRRASRKKRLSKKHARATV